MMRYEGNEELGNKSACAGVRVDLKMCWLQSNCCKKEKKTPRECLNRTDGSVLTNALFCGTRFSSAKDLCSIIGRGFVKGY